MSIIDFENRRKARRKRLLLISTLPMLIIFVIGIKFLSLPILSGIALNSYKIGEYDRAAGTYQMLLFTNWFESYKAPFNAGTSLIGQGEYKSAEENLKQALPLAPPERECDVRVNLSYAIEKQADAKLAEKKYDEAITLYSLATETVAFGGCIDRQNSQEESEDDKENKESGDEESGENKKQKDGQAESEDGQEPEDGENGDKEGEKSGADNKDSEDSGNKPSDEAKKNSQEEKESNQSKIDEREKQSQKKAAEAGKRLQEKSNDAKRQRNNENNNQNNNDDDSDQSNEDPAQLEKKLENLKNQNVEQNKKRLQSQRQSEQWDKRDNSYNYEKPW
jgi:hypothetical protein